MKTILVIGASSGIGKAVAGLLHANGDNVMATYNKGSMEGAPYPSHHLDVLVENLETSFLSKALDGLVYCPGTINLKPFARVSTSELIEDYRLQVIGFTKVLKEAIPLLKQGNDPSVIVFSTAAVKTGFPFHSIVSASKGALEGMCRSLAAEFAPLIRFNCIAPSITDTPLAAGILNSAEKRNVNAQRHPLKRIGNSSDIAELAAFLLSTNSSWITGQVIHCDGGITSLKN